MKWKSQGALFAMMVALPVAAFGASFNRGGDFEEVQLPPPIGVHGPGRKQCAPEYQRLLKLQIDGLTSLQKLARGHGETLCATLEGADQRGANKLLDPKLLEPLLTPPQRELLEALGVDLSKVDVARLMRVLGVDLSQIDLQQLKQQCRQSQGGLDQFATNELKRLQSEVLRCDDRV